MNEQIKELAKELCEKSGCHHKCHDTKDCVVEDEALLLINENKSNNFDVKSNEELFKQALVEGLNRRFDKTLEEEAKEVIANSTTTTEKQIEEMARFIDAEKLLEELQEELDFETPMYTEEQNKYFNSGVRCAFRDVKKAPTVDVVPKSEAENYRSIAEHQQGIAMRRYFEIKQLKEKLEKAKSEVEALKDDNKFLQDRRFKEWSEVRQEVAREIFEEIDELLLQNATMQIATSTLHCKLAELKKKHTEEKQ